MYTYIDVHVDVFIHYIYIYIYIHMHMHIYMQHYLAIVSYTVRILLKRIIVNYLGPCSTFSDPLHHIRVVVRASSY